MKSKLINGEVEILIIDLSTYKEKGFLESEDLSKAFDFTFQHGIFKFKIQSCISGFGLLECSSSISGFGFSREPGKWKFFCRQSDMTEEQAAQLVAISRTLDSPKDYILSTERVFVCVDGSIIEKYKKSFQSLLKANGVLPANKYPVAPPTDDLSFYDNEDDYRKCLALWLEEEANVFNPDTTLVFIKQDNIK